MFITPAHAQAATTTASGGAVAAVGPGLLAFAPYLLVLAIFWFLVLRPQQARAKQQRARLGAVKKGDQVVTGGGLLGRVTRVDDDQVEVEIAQGVRVRALKSMLSDVVMPGGKPAND